MIHRRAGFGLLNQAGSAFIWPARKAIRTWGELGTHDGDHQPGPRGRIVGGDDARIEGHATTIVGVMPERFRSSAMEGRARFWIPLMPAASEMGRSYNVFMVMGRLKPGITLERARNDMALIARRLEQQYPNARRSYPTSQQKGWGIRIEGIHSYFVRKGTAPETRLLMTAFGFLLLIVCANVANLLLAQGADRRKEIGVRIALGAGRL